MISSVRIMTASGIWEKAEKLFREMGLDHDLAELKRLKLEMNPKI